MTHIGKPTQHLAETHAPGCRSPRRGGLGTWVLASIACLLPALVTAQSLYFNFAQSIYNADITISAAPTSNGAFSGSSPGVFTPFAGANTATVNLTEMIALLNSGTSVTINTANTSGTGVGNIGLGSAMTWTGVSPSVGLNLNASHDINVTGALTATTGSFKFSAYDNVNIGGAMTTTTGSMTFLASNNVNLNSAASITTGDFTAIAGGLANMDAPITVVNGTTTVVSGAAPEIDGSLAPQVALLLGCLYLMFSRSKTANSPGSARWKSETISEPATRPLIRAGMIAQIVVLAMISLPITNAMAGGNGAGQPSGTTVGGTTSTPTPAMSAITGIIMSGSGPTSTTETTTVGNGTITTTTTTLPAAVVIAQLKTLGILVPSSDAGWRGVFIGPSGTTYTLTMLTLGKVRITSEPPATSFIAQQNAVSVPGN